MSGFLSTNPNFDQLRSESVRLSTFRDWPAGATVLPRDLAAAGLFYTGRVQCAYCRGFLRNWFQGDRPIIEHSRHFPNCSFVRQQFEEDGAEDEIDG